MKLSTGLHAFAAALTGFSLAVIANGILSSNLTLAGAGAVIGAVGQSIEAAAHVIERPGNGA